MFHLYEVPRAIKSYHFKKAEWWETGAGDAMGSKHFNGDRVSILQMNRGLEVGKQH